MFRVIVIERLESFSHGFRCVHSQRPRAVSWGVRNKPGKNIVAAEFTRTAGKSALPAVLEDFRRFNVLLGLLHPAPTKWPWVSEDVLRFIFFFPTRKW